MSALTNINGRLKHNAYGLELGRFVGPLSRSSPPSVACDVAPNQRTAPAQGANRSRGPAKGYAREPQAAHVMRQVKSVPHSGRTAAFTAEMPSQGNRAQPRWVMLVLTRNLDDLPGDDLRHGIIAVGQPKLVQPSPAPRIGFPRRAGLIRSARSDQAAAVRLQSVN